MSLLQRWTAVLCMAACCSSSPVAGQYTTGRVEGSVLDPTGATAGSVDVRLIGRQTGSERDYKTSEDGVFSFAAVAPGDYRLAVSKPGFAAAAVDIRVVSSQTTTHNVTLSVGDASTAIDVVGEVAPVLQSSEPLRSTTRTTLEIATLPNAARNITNLIILAPGVTPAFHPRGGSLTTLSIAQAGQMNANGGRSKATAHQLDFTDANDWEFGGIALGTQPTPDMLQELRILTNNWSAEYGVKASAEVILITRSGSNSLHGTAYNFLQNSRLNARDYFDTTGKPVPLRQNFFGFTAGAPVLRNRTFVFGGYEGRRTRGAGTTTIAALPTESARNSVTDADVRSVLGMLPIPTAPTSNALVGTLAVQPLNPSMSNQFLLRGDHQFSSMHSVTARYFESAGSNFNWTPNSLPGFDATFNPSGRNAMLASTLILGSRATNELRLAYGRSSALFTPETTPATPRFVVPGLVGFGTVQFWPQGRIFNVYQINDVVHYVRGRHAIKTGFDLRRIQDNSINDSNRRGVFTFPSVEAFLAGAPSAFTQVFGNTYRGFRMDYHGAFVQDDWKLSPSLTLNLGLRYELQGGMSETNQLQSVLDPRLTASIGEAGPGPLGAFRNQSPVVEGNPNLWSPRIGFAWNPGAGVFVLRGGYGVYWDSFLFNGLQAGRTTPPINYTGSLSGAQIAGGNSFSRLLAGTAAEQLRLTDQIGGFGSLTNLGSVTSTLPTLRNPYMQHFSLGTQYRLASGLAVDVSYVGTKGTALTTFGPANSVAVRPAPATSLADEQSLLAEFQSAFSRINGSNNTRLDRRFNDVNLLRDNGSSIYHSLQAELRKGFGLGLQFQASYTWSKSIDNASDYSPGQATTDRSFAQDQFSFANERAVSSFDIPHRLVLTHVWQLPVFRDQRGVAGRLLGGWTFASINQWQTGIPYTVMSGPRLGISDVNMDGNASGLDNARASCVAGASAFRFGQPVPPPNQRGVNGAPNGSNFQYVQPLLGNHGTCGRNTERMNNLLNFDWTLTKNLRLREDGPLGSGPYGLELRADFFNIFNTPFLTAAGDDFRNLASTQFGLPNAAAPSRRVQLALRLTW